MEVGALTPFAASHKRPAFKGLTACIQRRDSANDTLWTASIHKQW